MTRHNPIVILGAGGHATVLFDLIRLLNIEILGIVSPSVPIHPPLKYLKWLGNDEEYDSSTHTSISLINGIGSVKSVELRKKIFELYKSRNYTFTTLIHPTTTISKTNVNLGHGLVSLARSIIGPSVQIGNNVLVNSGAIIEHDSSIGDHCHIATGSIICGSCHLGKEVHIGAGAIINQGIRIGDGAIIASGSVVIKDVAPRALVMGVPAQVKRYTSDHKR